MSPSLRHPETNEPLRGTNELDFLAKGVAYDASPESFRPRYETNAEKVSRLATEAGVDISADIERVRQPQTTAPVVPYEHHPSEVREDTGYKPSNTETTIKIIKHNAGLSQPKPKEGVQPPAPASGSSPTIGAVLRQRETEQRVEGAKPPEVS